MEASATAAGEYESAHSGKPTDLLGFLTSIGQMLSSKYPSEIAFRQFVYRTGLCVPVDLFPVNFLDATLECQERVEELDAIAHEEIDLKDDSHYDPIDDEWQLSGLEKRHNSDESTPPQRKKLRSDARSRDL